MGKSFTPPAKVFGSKGGSVKRTADNLFSTDVVEAILGVSEGPIKGLANGAKSFLIGDTPLQANDGSSNFDGFELIVREGGVLGEDIYPRMGGFGASTTVGVELANLVPVVRSGLRTNIDYIDIRLVINRLYKEKSSGTHEHTGMVKVEYKRTDETEWTPIRSPETDPMPLSVDVPGGKSYYPSPAKNPFQLISMGWDYLTHLAGSAPSAPASTKAVWFNISQNYQPYTFVGASWKAIAGAVRTGNTWTWDGGKATYRATPPASKAVGDAWIDTDNNLTHIWNGDTWVIAGSSFAPGGVGSNGTGGSLTVTDGVISIFGKTTSPFVKEFRIPVQSHPVHTYDIRLTRTSGENSTRNNFDVSWESFQELTADKMNFPGLATVQLTARASEQFSSIPEFSGIFQGRIVRVPTNYNPTTRVYTGVWDGTWKLAYTNNAAFVGYDLIQNTRYGMSAYYPVTVNKWDVYEAGKWCDAIAADGSPRFTFNGIIDQPRNGREAIDYIFGTFGGRFFDDGNGSGVIRIDNDSAAVALFTPENVEKGLFSYSQTPLSTRHNDITVTFINPLMNWQEDRRRISDDDDIAKYGRNPTSIIAYGCTSIEEAIRRARYKLVTGLTEKTMVGFTTNRAAAFLQPYDVILIGDEDLSFGHHGRVKSVVNASRIQLREPIFLETGVSYRLSFTVIDTVQEEYTVATVDVSPGQTGLRTEINVNNALPGGVAEGTVFSLHKAGTNFSPKPFRVADIEVDSDNGDMVKVTAIEVNRAKWDYVDGLIDEIEYNGFYDLETSQIPQPVPSATVEVVKRAQGTRVIRDMNFSWSPSPSTFVTKYRLSYSADGGPMAQLTEIASLRYVWKDITPANYVFMVEPVGFNGLLGQPAYFEHKMIREDGQHDVLTGLTASNSGIVDLDGTYKPIIQVTWDAFVESPISGYLIKWRPVGANEWQSAASQGPLFEITGVTVSVNYEIAVRAISDAIALTDWTSVTIVVIGDVVAPPMPTNWVGEATFDMIVLRGDVSPASDFKAFRIYGSPADNTTLTLLAEQPSNHVVRHPAVGDVFTRYRVSAIDFSGNESSKTPYISVAPMVLPGTIVKPTTPTGLTLTSSLMTDGKVRLVATWNASTQTGIIGYDVRLREGAGNYVSFPSTEARYEWTVLPGVTFTAQVRARNTYNNVSSNTAEVTHTSAVDTIAPNTPTGVTATGSSGAIWLKWNANTESDLARYEIYEHTATTPAPTSGTVATYASTATTFVRSGLDASNTRHYWVRAVDTSGNKSAWAARVQATTVASAQITAADLNGLVSATSFAAGIEPVTVVTGSLPTVKSTTAILFNGEIYRWNGTAYVKTVSATDVTGQILSPQIADAAISVAKFASSLRPIEILGALPGTPHIKGRTVLLTTDDKIYRNTGSGWTASVPASDLSGTLTSAQIATLDAAKLTGTIVEARLASLDAAKLTGIIDQARIDSVAAGKISGQLTNEQIDTIAAAKLTGQITGTQITDNSVTTAKLSAGAVTANEIAANTITAAKIAASTITATQIASGAITTAKLVAGAVTANELASGSVIAGKIAAGTITATDIAANTITGAKIAANTITATQIAATTITANELASNSVIAGKIAAGAVTANSLAANSVISGKIAAGAITATEIAANAITAKQIAIGDFSNIADGSDFEDPARNPWLLKSGVEINSTFVYSGANALQITSAQADHCDLNTQIGVQPGDKLYVSFWARSTSLWDGDSNFKMRFGVTGSGVHVASVPYGSAFLTAATVWQNLTAVITVPTGCTSLTVQLYKGAATAGSVSLDDIVIRRMATGSLIVDGTITGTNIAAGAITAAQIAGNTITAGQIAAGAIGAEQIAAKAIVASKIGVMDLENLWPDGTWDSRDADLFDTSVSGTTFWSAIASTGNTALAIQKSVLTNSVQATLKNEFAIPVRAGEKFWAETWARGNVAASAGFYYRVLWLDAAKNPLAAPNAYTDVAGSNLPLTTTFQQITAQITAPTGARFARWQIYNHSTNTTATTFYIDRLILRRANGAELIVDGTIKGRHIETASLVADLATVTTAYIKDANISGSLSAAKLTAGSAMANTITVNGSALGSVQGWAADPAARVNTMTTLIDPGKIEISGTTSLSSWIMGGDTTKINGGAISANTISANKLEIGSRGVTLTGIEWEHNSPAVNRADWTAGTIRYTNDSGTETATNITAGSTSTWTTGVIYIYWVKGATVFSTTTSQATAQGSDRLILATYEGGAKLDADYGRTIIDGSKIKTNTITATQIAASTITGTQIAGSTITGSKIAGNTITATQIAANTITATEIAANTITAAQMTANAITARELASNTITADHISTAGIQSTNYAAGSAGWRIRKDGSAEFNGVVVSKQMLVASGSVVTGQAVTGTQYKIDTGLPVSAWTGPKKTYIAAISNSGSLSEAGNMSDSLRTWGFKAEILPLTRWTGIQNLHILATLDLVGVYPATNFTANWRLYEVT